MKAHFWSQIIYELFGRKNTSGGFSKKNIERLKAEKNLKHART